MTQGISRFSESMRLSLRRRLPLKTVTKTWQGWHCLFQKERNFIFNHVTIDSIMYFTETNIYLLAWSLWRNGVRSRLVENTTCPGFLQGWEKVPTGESVGIIPETLPRLQGHQKWPMSYDLWTLLLHGLRKQSICGMHWRKQHFHLLETGLEFQLKKKTFWKFLYFCTWV